MLASSVSQDVLKHTTQVDQAMYVLKPERSNSCYIVITAVFRK